MLPFIPLPHSCPKPGAPPPASWLQQESCRLARRAPQGPSFFSLPLTCQDQRGGRWGVDRGAGLQPWILLGGVRSQPWGFRGRCTQKGFLEEGHLPVWILPCRVGEQLLLWLSGLLAALTLRWRLCRRQHVAVATAALSKAEYRLSQHPGEDRHRQTGESQWVKTQSGSVGAGRLA